MAELAEIENRLLLYLADCPSKILGSDHSKGAVLLTTGQ